MKGTVVQADARLIRYRLERAVGGSGVSFVDVIVVELRDGDGVTGLGFSYVLAADGALCHRAAELQLDRFVRDKPLSPPQATWRSIGRSFNRTGLGPNLVGLAAIDVAMWDLHSKRIGVPLAIAMGGAPRAVDVYGSGGFTAVQAPEEAADNASRYFQAGFKAVKPRMRGERSDEAMLDAVAQIAGNRGYVMADANEKCDLAGARWLLSLARERGVLFVEEPLPAASLAGYRALAGMGVNLAAGEHLQQREVFSSLMSERVLAVVQPDLAMIGGLTPVLDLCVLADAMDIVVSPHFLPGLFVHVAAAAPALRWLEDFPLLEPMFEGWADIAGGQMSPSDRPGHGLRLAERFRSSPAVP